MKGKGGSKGSELVNGEECHLIVPNLESYPGPWSYPVVQQVKVLALSLHLLGLLLHGFHPWSGNFHMPWVCPPPKKKERKKKKKEKKKKKS